MSLWHTYSIWIQKYWMCLYWACLFLLTCCLYLPVIHAPFLFDDFSSIIDNPVIRSVDLEKILAFQPLRFIGYFSLALNFHFSGLDPFSYHMVNIFIHLAYVLFSFLFIQTLWQTPSGEAVKLSKNEKRLLGLATISILAIHPLSTFAVSYIVQRLASLTALFYVGSLFLYLKARLCINFKVKIIWSFFFVLFLVAALFSKQNSFTIFPQILLIEIICFGLTRRKQIICVGILILLALGFFFSIQYNLIDLDEIRKMSVETKSISRLEYLFTQFSVVCFYLRSVFFPTDLALDYESTVYNSITDLNVFIPGLILTAILLISLWAATRKKYKLIAYGVIFYFTAISIESSIIPIRDVIFLHRTYLPNLGLTFSVVWLVYAGLKNKKINRWVLGLIFGIYMGILSGVTIETNLIFQVPEKVWTRVLEMAPRHIRGYINRSQGYIENKAYAKALADCNTAIKIDQKSPEIYNNRGLAYQNTKKIDKAILDFQQAIALAPKYADAYNNNGVAHYEIRKNYTAILNYNKAILFDPKNAIYYNNRGAAYHKEQKYDLAMLDCTKAIALNPLFAEAFQNRGRLYFRKKEYKQAIADYTRAIELNPWSASQYYERGVIFSDKKEYQKAISDYTKAIEIEPDYTKAYYNRGIMFFALKAYDLSYSDIQKVLSLNGKVNPALMQALKNRE